jgi:AP-4 complex subunit mu-1
VNPVFTVGGTQYINIKKNSLYFLLVTKDNVSSTYMLELLNRITNLIKDYTGSLSEESVRKNHILIYELLDEMLDNGTIQTLNTAELKLFTLNDPIETLEPSKFKLDTNTLTSLFSEKKMTTSDASKRPVQTSKFKKNEIFVDFLERINITMNSKGEVIHSEILGCVIMKLMGNPTIRLCFEDFKIPYFSFSDFVNRDEFEKQKTIQFHPPDGEFSVMQYKTNQMISEVPFRFYPLIETISEYKVHWIIKLVCTLDKLKVGTHLLIRIPLPSVTHNVVVEFSSQNNSCEYKSNEKVVLWGIQEIQGQSEHICSIRMTFGKSLVGNDLKRSLGPLSMKFEIPMTNYSGLTVRYLKIEERGDYTPQRWIRYITQASSYVYRV